jgi:hypothetical protein
MRILLALLPVIPVLALTDVGWAADTDVDNPALRDLPIQRGPIYGGKQHQPTQTEVIERLQEQHGGGSAATSAPGSAATPAATTAPGSIPASAPRDELYLRVLKQSQQGMPRVLPPEE